MEGPVSQNPIETLPVKNLPESDAEAVHILFKTCGIKRVLHALRSERRKTFRSLERDITRKNSRLINFLTFEQGLIIMAVFLSE